MHTPKNRRKHLPFRREIILSVAKELFNNHGYESVSMDEIAAAAGITGPGIYRHFRSKRHLFAAIIEKDTTWFWAGTREMLDRAKTPREALEDLVKLTVGASVQNRVLISAYHQERHLPEPEHRRVRSRQRLLLEEWVNVLSQIRPDLSAAEVRMAVLAVWESVGHQEGRVELSRLAQLLSSMALSALLGNREDIGPRRSEDQ